VSRSGDAWVPGMTSGGIDVRVADPESPDATQLVADFFAEIARRYPGFDPANQPSAPLHAFTAENGGVFLIASLDGSPVGCAGLQRLDARMGEVRRVFVREVGRRRGVSRAMLDALVHNARNAGYERLRLDTGDRLPEAVSLFRSVGFYDIDDYNGNPYAAHWMELAL
jgi:GNAT superfamily N-acetyltransferase